MPLILGIETSTDRCSVALGDGEGIEERMAVRPREHHALVLPMVQELLDDAGAKLADVDAIAFGRGPGSFTGLRIAASIAQGLAFGAGLPVVPVSSLDALALGVTAELVAAGLPAQLFVAVDAHMGEIYWARYRLHGAPLQAEPGDQLARVEGFDLCAWVDPAMALAAGSAFRVYPQLLPPGMRALGDALPAARHVVELALRTDAAGWLPAERAEPAYVRGVTTWKKIAEQ